MECDNLIKCVGSVTKDLLNRYGFKRPHIVVITNGLELAIEITFDYTSKRQAKEYIWVSEPEKLLNENDLIQFIINKVPEIAEYFNK